MTREQIERAAELMRGVVYIAGGAVIAVRAARELAAARAAEIGGAVVDAPGPTEPPAGDPTSADDDRRTVAESMARRRGGADG